MTTTPDNKRAADMSLDELQAKLAWLEAYPVEWWSQRVYGDNQRNRDRLNENRKWNIEVIEEEIALRRGKNVMGG